MFLEPFILLNNIKTKHVITYNHQNQEYIVYYYIIKDNDTELDIDIKSKNFSDKSNIIYYFKTVDLLKIYFGELETIENGDYNIQFCIQNGIVLLRSDTSISEKINNYVALLLTTIDYHG
jgi:hypothetical protein